MKWAFDLLQLPLDADATSIKRAYAQLLRRTRPDEDPEGFQRLHAAYKTALAQAGVIGGGARETTAVATSAIGALVIGSTLDVTTSGRAIGAGTNLPACAKAVL